MVRNQRDISDKVTNGAFTVTNINASSSVDVNVAAEVGDGVGNLMQQLSEMGIITASVS